MEPRESSFVVPESEIAEIAEIEQQLENEIVEIEHKTADWLKDLASFATALIVTTAGVFVAGVVGILFCYAFFVAAPLLFVVLAVATARSLRRHRALAH